MDVRILSSLACIGLLGCGMAPSADPSSPMADATSPALPVGGDTTTGGAGSPTESDGSSTTASTTWTSTTSTSVATLVHPDVPCEPGELVYTNGADGVALFSQAVQASEPGDVLTLCPGVHIGPVSIGFDLRVEAIGGPDVTTIDGRSDGASVAVMGGAVELVGVTVHGGIGFPAGEIRRGGGLYVDPAASLAAVDCVVYGNTATEGGGAYLGGPSSLTRCTVEDNVADGSGGGVFAGGPADLVDVVVRNNTSGGHGGGVNLGAEATLVRPVVEGNTALYGGGIAGVYLVTIHGGSVRANSALHDGGGLYGFDLSINDTVVSDNAAESGGGVFALAGDVTLRGAEIRDNQAVGGGGLKLQEVGRAELWDAVVTGNLADESGGGVLVSEGAWVVLDGTEISHNAALIGGGMALDAAGRNVVECDAATRIENNEALSVGGGIEVWQGTVTGCVVRGNTAYSGGGISGTGVFDSVTLEDNSSENVGGAGILNESSELRGSRVARNHSASGGGIGLAGGQLQLVDTDFEDNSADAGTDLWFFLASGDDYLSATGCDFGPSSTMTYMDLLAYTEHELAVDDGDFWCDLDGCR
jgi:hypothetical protein